MTKITNPDDFATTWSVDPELPAGYSIDEATGVVTCMKASADPGVFFTRRVRAEKGDGREIEVPLTFGLLPEVSGAPSEPVFGSDLSTRPYTLTSGTEWNFGDGSSSNLQFRRTGTPTFLAIYRTVSLVAGQRYRLKGIVSLIADKSSLTGSIRARIWESATPDGDSVLFAAWDNPNAGDVIDISTTPADSTSTTHPTDPVEHVPGEGYYFTARITGDHALGWQVAMTAGSQDVRVQIQDDELVSYTLGASRPSGDIVYTGAASLGADADTAYSRDLLADFAGADELRPVTTLPEWAVLDNGALTGTPSEGAWLFTVEARNSAETLQRAVYFQAPGLPEFEDAYWSVEPELSPDPAEGPIYAGDAVRIVAGTAAGDGPFATAISGAEAPADFGEDVTLAEGAYAWTVTLEGASGEETTRLFAFDVLAAVAPPDPGDPEAILDGATWTDNGDENLRLTLAAPLPADYTVQCRIWNDGATEPTWALAAMTVGGARDIWSGVQGFQHGGPTARKGRVQVLDADGLTVDEAVFDAALCADISAPSVVAALPTQDIASGGAISIDVSGVFDTGTDGLTVAGLPAGASYAAGTISADAAAVADGSYSITLTASNAVAHNGAGGTTSSAFTLQVGDEAVVDPGDISNPGAVASLSYRTSGLSRSGVSGGDRLTVDGTQDEYAASVPLQVTPLAEYRLRMTVDTTSLAAGVPVHVRAGRAPSLPDGDSGSRQVQDSAFFEHCVYGGSGVQTVEFWFMPTVEIVHLGVRIGRKPTGASNWKRTFTATPNGSRIDVTGIRCDYAPPTLEIGATASLSSVRDRSVIWTFNQPATVRRAATGHYCVVAAPGLTLTGTNWPSENAPGVEWGGVTTGLTHGLEVNRAASDAQGFDARPCKTQQGYQSGRNSDPAIAGPLDLSAPKSLRKAVGFTWPMSFDARVPIQQYVDLHVVPALPAADALPPTNVASSKASAYAESGVNFALLPSLAVPSGAPRWEEAALYALGSDYEHSSANNPAHTNVWPRLNGGGYSRELRNAQSVVWMHLLGDQMPAAWKERVALAMIQAGLNFADRRGASGYFVPKGANWGLRKPYAVLAATLLGDTGTLAANAANTFTSETMTQTVSQDRINTAPTGSQSGAAYIQAQLGQPEFTQRPVVAPDPDWWHDGLDANEVKANGGSDWGVLYRTVSANDNLGWALAMRLIAGAEAKWGAIDTALRYLDRQAYESARLVPNEDAPNPYVLAFWRAHRCRDKPVSLNRWGLLHASKYAQPALRSCRRNVPFSLDVAVEEFGKGWFTGGRIPDAFSVVSGSLPGGLSLSGAGVISGTPSGTTGIVTLTIRGTHTASGTSADAVVKLQVTA